MAKMTNYPLSIKSHETDGSFSGYASVFGIVDSQGEEIAPGAFMASLDTWRNTQKMPKLLWQHDSRSPIGVWQEIHEDDHGLFVKGQLLLDIRQGREAYTLLKNGIVDGLSIGFQTLKARKSTSARILEVVALHEVSLVTFASNPRAKVNQVKMVDPWVDSLLCQMTYLKELMKGGR